MLFSQKKQTDAEGNRDETAELLQEQNGLAKRTGKNRAVSERDLTTDETIPKAA